MAPSKFPVVILVVLLTASFAHFTFDAGTRGVGGAKASGGAAMGREDVVDFIIRNINPDRIRANLRLLTSRPHMAGTAAEALTAEWVAETWRAQGLDEVQDVPYEVLLSYPSKDEPNLVRLLDRNNGSTLWESSPRQPPLYAPEEERDDVPFNFNAYAAPGNVQGGVVYVNYGQEEDFRVLEEAGVRLQGNIVLARYGLIFRSNIVASAELRGVAGVVLYTDPADYALLGPEHVYPHNVMMPPSGVQLGTVKLRDGDPLTPYYPAIKSAFHIPEGEAPIPKIPVQPISYDDAWTLLNTLGGPEAPGDWQGTLNLTYRLGPTLPDYLVNLDVHTHNVPTTVHNVIGVIKGAEEPDRYVVLGNHRDAWIFGAIDPSSGTAVMMELSRVLMELHKQTGWRPRRSVVLCSWAAEEYGLVGSHEWTEQFAKQLSDRAVAYLNVDLVMQANYSFSASAVPLLHDVIWEASKLVPNPDADEVAAGRESVYDTWLVRRPDPQNASLPAIELLGSGSDYAGFLHNIGIPCLDIRYTHDGTMPGWYPVYHSLYDTFALVDEMYDPGFLFHGAETAVWAIITTTLADAQVLPLSLGRYAEFVVATQEQIVRDFGAMVTDHNVTLDYFLAAGATFLRRTTEFQAALEHIDHTNPLAVRAANDQMMMVERAFIDPRGLPGRPYLNHVVMAPSESNTYSGAAFSGLTDALTGIQSSDDEAETLILWRQFEEHLAAVTHLLSTAAAVLGHLWEG